MDHDSRATDRQEVGPGGRVLGDRRLVRRLLGEEGPSARPAKSSEVSPVAPLPAQAVARAAAFFCEVMGDGRLSQAVESLVGFVGPEVSSRGTAERSHRLRALVREIVKGSVWHVHLGVDAGRARAQRRIASRILAACAANHISWTIDGSRGETDWARRHCRGHCPSASCVSNFISSGPADLHAALARVERGSGRGGLQRAALAVLIVAPSQGAALCKAGIDWADDELRAYLADPDNRTKLQLAADVRQRWEAGLPGRLAGDLAHPAAGASPPAPSEGDEIGDQRRPSRGANRKGRIARQDRLCVVPEVAVRHRADGGALRGRAAEARGVRPGPAVATPDDGTARQRL